MPLTSPPRVVYAIDSLDSGGAQRQAVEIAAALVERGDVHASFAVYHEGGFFRDRLDAAGIEVHRLRKSAKLDVLFPLRLRKHIAREAPDIVHAYLLPPSVWSSIALLGRRRPALVVGERDSRIAEDAGQRLLQGLVYRGADAVTANAEPVADDIVAKLGVPRERVHYIPNGIDLAAWDRELEREPELEFDPDCFHVALVGRIARQKSHDVVIRALTRIPDAERARFRVWFIGRESDTDSATLRQLMTECGVEETVRFVPPQRVIAPIIGRVDALLLPSRHEGFPNAVLEAFASRTPVIATPVGDVPNLVEDGRTGLLVPVDDVDALAAALLRMLRTDAPARSEMGAAGRRVAEERFPVARIADRYLELYRSLSK